MQPGGSGGGPPLEPGGIPEGRLPPFIPGGQPKGGVPLGGLLPWFWPFTVPF